MVHEIIMKVPSAWKGHEDFALWLINKLQPAVIVDLGVNRGFSTFVFASAKIGEVYGIDWFKGDDFMLYRGTFNEKLYNYVKRIEKQLKDRKIINHLEIIRDDFSKASKRWTKSIDILHIDGSHHYVDVKSDYDNWSKFVKDSGVILFHDVWIPRNQKFHGVNDFFNEVPLHKCMFKTFNGLGIASKNNLIIDEIKTKYGI